MKNSHLEEVNEAEIVLFKKKLKKMKQFKGRGTELISLYLPPAVDRSSVMAQITEELSQSSNIKSPTTRKNVQGSLRKLNNFLKQINFKLPEKGLVVFSGNVSEQEGKSDIRLFTIKPPRELKTKLYWCDSEFHLVPLEEMVAPTDIFGILTIDNKESTIAILVGKKYEILGHFTSGVSGKHRAGGQCLVPNTLIQLSDGNIVEISKCHNPSGVKTADFYSFSVEDSFINDKWNTVKNETATIITKEPRLEIACSKDHSLFCWKHGKIAEKTAGKLEKGQFLLIPEKIRVKGVAQKLQSNYFNSFTVLKRGRRALKEARTSLGLFQRELAGKAGLCQANISALELGKFCPRNRTLGKICNHLGIDFNLFVQKHCKPNSEIRLPKEIGWELAQLIGYFAGDGSFEEERLSFFEEREEIANEYEKLAARVFNANTSVRFRKTKNYFTIRVYGKAIIRYLRGNFPELNSKSIPKKVLKSPDRILAGFLRGLFDAEGYVSHKKVALGMNNEKLVKQVQLALLRFGILAGIHRYDNRKNPYSNKIRFTVQLSEKKSIELFKEKIGFSSTEKSKQLSKEIAKIGNKSSVRQISSSGKQIRELIEKNGFKVTDFPRVTNFFRNERMMSKQAFKNSVIGFAKNEGLIKELETVLKRELLPVKIASISRKKASVKMVDISVENQNFIAGGIVSHNSAQRFERLHEDAVNDFYKRIGTKLTEIFVPYGDKLKGLLIAGPGITKNYFMNQDRLDHRLKEKVLGTIDTSYTDESGIREAVNKSSELLRDAEITKEKNVVNNFMGEVVKPGGLAAYGQQEVEEALLVGKVETLLLSEEIEWMVYKFKCNSCDTEEEIVVKEPTGFEPSKHKCKKCDSALELMEEVDYTDWIVEKAMSTGTETKIISTDTSEGEQFLKGFGGIGAILRFR